MIDKNNKTSGFIAEDVSGEMNDKQKSFCHHFVANKFNAKQAAISAGYAAASAEVTASRLLSQDKVQAFIAVLKKDLGLRMGISRERIAAELAKIAFFDITKILNDDGAIKPVSEWDKDTAGAIGGMDVEELFREIGQCKKIKVWDKRAALETLNKMLGYNEPEKTETKIIGATINYNLQPGNDPLPEP